jgi:hypothetical protein
MYERKEVACTASKTIEFWRSEEEERFIDLFICL